MRIDKFLWCTRYFKTRSLATDACKKGHIRIDNAIAKASREVYGGEIIMIRKNQINYRCQILEIPANRVGAKIVGLYIKDTTPTSEFDKTELLKYSKDYYRKKGTGRPTKKDRRDIDNYNNNE